MYLRNLFKAGLPNTGPMGVEDCLTENIKQNKVKFVKMLFNRKQRIRLGGCWRIQSRSGRSREDDSIMRSAGLFQHAEKETLL